MPPEIPATALELAARAVLSHPWGSGPWTAHAVHQYHGECAVCQGDVRRMLAVAAQHLTGAHQSERAVPDRLRQRYADALARSFSPTTGLADHVDAVMGVRDDELERLRVVKRGVRLIAMHWAVAARHPNATAEDRTYAEAGRYLLSELGEYIGLTSEKLRGFFAPAEGEQPHAELERLRLRSADVLARLLPAIERVLIAPAGELDDALAELAHVHQELTGADIRAAAVEQTGRGDA